MVARPIQVTALQWSSRLVANGDCCPLTTTYAATMNASSVIAPTKQRASLQILSYRDRFRFRDDRGSRGATDGASYLSFEPAMTLSAGMRSFGARASHGQKINLYWLTRV